MLPGRNRSNNRRACPRRRAPYSWAAIPPTWARMAPGRPRRPSLPRSGPAAPDDAEVTVEQDSTLRLIESYRAASKGTLPERMGITIVEASAERVVDTMPVDGNTQPYGLLHGGASCVLAETLGSL